MITSSRSRLGAACLLAAIGCAPAVAQTNSSAPAPAPIAARPAAAAIDSTADEVATMVSRLNLESYKATVKGLTKFGDRRQGTDRNRAAIDWIEAQLKSYGCTPTERTRWSCRRRESRRS